MFVRNGRLRPGGIAGCLVAAVALCSCVSASERSSPTLSATPPSVSSSSHSTSTDEGAAGIVRVKCEDAIGQPAAGTAEDTSSEVLGVAWLPTSPHHTALQTSATRDANPALRLFAKQGLVARATSEFEILIPAEFVGRAAVDWGNPGMPTTHLRFGPCASTPTKTGWLAYAGGYLVADPICLPLTVRAGGHELRVNVGVGRPCPGQSANPGPSDP